MKDDKTKDGWTLVEDVPFDGQPFEIKIVNFLTRTWTSPVLGMTFPGESSVNGEEMKKRAKNLDAHLGQGHAEYLLENQDKIPAEYRGKYYLVFPGTVWLDLSGNRLVPCLDWYGDGDDWCLGFRLLKDDYYSNARLVEIHR